MRYLRRKALFYLVAVWAAVTLNFLIPRLIKGNPVDVVLAKTQSLTPMPPEARRALELQFGVSHDPIWVQYFGYLNNLIHGQLGLSVSYYPAPVTTVISKTLPWTVIMVGMATVISVLIGITLGMLAAIPYFWLALVLLYLLGGVLSWFPLNGGYAYTTTVGWNGPFLGSAIYHGVLPALSIVLASMAGWMLGMRNMMVSTMGEDYVTTAEAKGLKSRRIMLHYAARNAILPSVAGFAITLGFVVSGSLVSEVVFSYPGIGTSLLAAVQNVDYPLMQGIFLVIALSVLGANFIVDLLYALIDPRTRQAG